MEIYKAIERRSSVRSYTDKRIEKFKIEKILQAAILAPSGKNGQPWRFAVVWDDKELLRNIADCTVYKDFVRTADCLVCVYLDKKASYNYTKDCQAIGACIQNMLLAATAERLGACWIGEILAKADETNNLLRIDGERYELMAVIALGYPMEKQKNKSPRKSVSECTLLSR